MESLVNGVIMMVLIGAAVKAILEVFGPIGFAVLLGAALVSLAILIKK